MSRFNLAAPPLTAADPVAGVGDAGVLGSATSWTNSAKAVPIGAQSFSYVVEADVESSVVVKLITQTPDNGLRVTETQSFGLSAAGPLTLLRDEISLSAGCLLF
jgi:hypothetical protein